MAAIMALAFTYPKEVKSDIPATPQLTTLQQRQEVWITALQWCESRGKDEAVNPKDRDGTPSYGAFQFKPSTFYNLSARYGLSTSTDYMDSKQQREIVRRMLADKSMTNDEMKNRQFPDCIQHKVGLPPR